MLSNQFLIIFLWAIERSNTITAVIFALDSITNPFYLMERKETQLSANKAIAPSNLQFQESTPLLSEQPTNGEFSIPKNIYVYEYDVTLPTFKSINKPNNENEEKTTTWNKQRISQILYKSFHITDN